jgi:peptide/nickel transport system permease protein
MTAAAAAADEPGLRPRRWVALKRLLGDPLGRLGLILVLIVVVGAIGADQLASHDPFKMMMRERLQGPSFAHLLGTDNLGRDVFSRVLYGGRVALWVSLIAVYSSLAIGLTLGMLAGYGPRWLDNALLLVFDAVRSFPTVMFAMALVTLVGPSLNTIIAIVIITSMPLYGRIVRTQTLSLKAQEFILAEQALGAGTLRVLVSHVLPNVIGPVLILASMEIPVVITLEAGLSFLGFGVRPPTPSWGSILNDGYQFIRDTPWLVISGGVPLVVSTLGFTLLGEALRDIFDPKLARD